jgi:hypothetical protein
MDPFTTAYLANLAANLSALIIPKAARRLEEQWQGEPSAAALQRCLEAAILGMVSKASLDEPEQQQLLADIFSDFFQDKAVAVELMRLVHVQSLSLETLEELFAEASYDAETLPSLHFAEAITAFEAAFLEAAALEPALQPVIQVHQGWAQTALQREMVILMRQMVKQSQATDQPVGIQAGSIVAENVVSGTQIIYQWQPGLLPPPATYQATLHGRGAIAQGEGATAVGERGVLVTGNDTGPIITGSGNTIYSGGTAVDPVAIPRCLAPLRDQLARLFDKSELNGLCFDLGMAADDLPGETHTALAQALVAHCYRQELLPELLAYGRNLRPHANWSIEHE